ncbi:MAG: LysR family transcriptional regulator [Pseudomonadales bacterium]|nr:LysR family transcriptional regulator [Pseudomonadales bacterium]
MSLSIKQLRYICAVAEHLHFGRAAEACYVTQSTLSASVQDLEDFLGVPIFERTKKHVMVTDKGSELLKRASRILEDGAD